MRAKGTPENRPSTCALLAPLLVVVMMLLAGPTQALELRVAHDGHTAGYLTLAWDHDGEVELQQRTDNGTWQTVYRGADTATTLTGLADGELSWRARMASADWGETLTVRIDHHPLSRALAFFGIGAVMLIILLVCIALPWRDEPVTEPDAAA